MPYQCVQVPPTIYRLGIIIPQHSSPHQEQPTLSPILRSTITVFRTPPFVSATVRLSRTLGFVGAAAAAAACLAAFELDLTAAAASA